MGDSKNSILKKFEDMDVEMKEKDHKKHQQIAKKIKAFQCMFCSRVFRRKQNINAHCKEKHPHNEFDASKINQVEFKCYLCPQGFYDYGSLENHFIEKHSEENLDAEKVYLGNTQITAAKFKHRKNKLNEEQTSSRNSTPKRPKIVGIKNYFSPKASGSTTSSSKSSGSTTFKLESDEEEEDNLIPFAFQKNEEKFVYVKKKPPFKCPMEESCRTSKNGKSFREHLSRHFASNI